VGTSPAQAPAPLPTLRFYLSGTRCDDLIRRVYEHKTKVVPGFTTKYGADKLVYFEIFDDPTSAITREKQLKKWRRDWKIGLIEDKNPGWVDLFPTLN
jgi:putative endonuclease